MKLGSLQPPYLLLPKQSCGPLVAQALHRARPPPLQSASVHSSSHLLSHGLTCAWHSWGGLARTSVYTRPLPDIVTRESSRLLRQTKLRSQSSSYPISSPTLTTIQYFGYILSISITSVMRRCLDDATTSSDTRSKSALSIVSSSAWPHCSSCVPSHLT